MSAAVQCHRWAMSACSPATPMALPSMVLCQGWDRMDPCDAELTLGDAGPEAGREQC